MRRRTVALFALLALPAAAADTVRTEAARLRFSVPRAWIRVPAPADERAAQWKLRRAAGDAEDGELVLFFPGEGKGGSVEENLDRWRALFIPPEGRPWREAGVVTNLTVHGLRVTVLDIAGIYKPALTSEGLLPPTKHGYRMLAAMIEGANGPWFFRATGPQATIAQTKPGFDAMLDSVEVHH